VGDFYQKTGTIAARLSATRPRREALLITTPCLLEKSIKQRGTLERKLNVNFQGKKNIRVLWHKAEAE